MYNNFDPYSELVELQQRQLRLDTEMLQLQKQLFQTLVTQQEILTALNNQAVSIRQLQNILKDHIESTYQPK
jgi:hypothetical protein